MLAERVIIDRLHNQKRIDVTPKGYLKRCKRQLIVHILLSVSIGSFIIWMLGPSVVSVAIAALIVIPVAIICYTIQQKTTSVAVKGGTLILNSLAHRSCVTSLRSVKHVRTNCILGIQFTRIKYNLDGRDKTAHMINRSWAVPTTPERLIKKAIKINKKKKANRKPGSVAVA